MRRRLRILLNVAALLSLLILFTRSQRMRLLQATGAVTELQGVCVLEFGRWDLQPLVIDREFRLGGFQYASGRSGNQPLVYLFVPVWLLLLTPAVAIATGLATRVRYRRVRSQPSATLCATCDYDLRATPDRCPECGTPVPLPQMPPEWKGEIEEV